MNDSLGDRMKIFETNNLPYKLWKSLPVYARLDAICFHSFCKGLKRPYDERLSELMLSLAEWLAKEFNANCAYTQSDEISLAWHIDNYESELYCDGKVQKLTSHLAAKASVQFNKLLPKFIPEKETPAYFDARVLNLPNIIEVSNMFLWRELDAARNSIQMAARSYFSAKELFKKNTSKLNEMLFSKGVNWNDYPAFFKRGTFIIRNTVLRDQDLSKIPEKLRESAPLQVERSEFIRYDMPPFSKVTNRTGVLFYEEKPMLGD